MALTKVTEKIISDNLSISGIASASNFKTGTTNVHNVGVEVAGINVLGADTPIGTGATIYNDGAARFSGVVTATSFSGSGANLTGIDATSIKHTDGNVKIQAINTGANLTGNLSVSGNLGVAGVLTYEDVTNVDSVGIVTVRTGIKIGPTAGVAGTFFADGSYVTAGIITATTFHGSGANLTTLNGSNISSGTVAAARIDNLAASKITSGTVATARLGSGTANNSSFLRGDQTWAAVTSTTINNNADNRIITGSGTANTLEGESSLTWDGNDLSLSGTAPAINFTDTDADDYKIHNVQGLLKVTDTTASADRFVINDNGTGYFLSNFQIGSTTSSPGATLHLKTSYPSLKVDSGGHASDAYVRIISGNAQNSRVDFGDSDDDDIGMIDYDHANNSMRFFTNTSEKLRIESGGDVSIGNVDANTFSNYRTLTIGGAGASDGAGIDLERSDGNIYGRLFADANGLQIGAPASGDYIRFETQNTERLRITSQGLLSGGSDAYWNTTLGTSSGNSFTGPGDAKYNTLIGHSAGSAITGGDYNTALGTYALDAVTGNSNNTAIGYGALTACTGAQNTSIGDLAGQGITSGTGNISIGYQALTGTSSSNYMVAIGYQALYTSGSLTNTIAIGFRAGYNNTSGSTNVLIGKEAAKGASAWTGDYNTLIGHEVAGNCSGAFNHVLGIGRKAAYNVKSSGGAFNSIMAIGNSALESHDGNGDNSTGGYTCSIGHYSLQSDRHIRHSTVVGLEAVNQWAPTTAQQSIHTAGYTSLGSGAMYNHRHGGANIAVGRNCMRGTNNSSGGTGNDNIAIGDRACENLTSGYRNVSIGRFANLRVESGYANVAIGWIANYAYDSTNSSTNGYENTIVGYYTRTSGYNTHKENVFGAGGVGKGTRTFYVNNDNGVYHGGNTTTWSTTSDQRIKKNIVDNNTGLDLLNSIQVRNFEYKTKDEITNDNPELENVIQSAVVEKEGLQIGVIAQELEKVLPECVKTQSTGIKTVDSDNLTWYLINAVKELSAEVKALKKQINS